MCGAPKNEGQSRTLLARLMACRALVYMFALRAFIGFDENEVAESVERNRSRYFSYSLEDLINRVGFMVWTGGNGESFCVLCLNVSW